MKLGLFDQLQGFLSPQMLLQAAEKMIPPSNRLLLQLIPQAMQSAFDIANKPLPQVTIKAQPDTFKVAVVYQFANAQDMQAFYDMESKNIALMQAIEQTIKAQKGKQGAS
jgi:hypothetical protein